MLNLVIVGCGNKLKLVEFVSAIRNGLKPFINEGDNIYDLNTLYKAESSPEHLKKKGILKFPTHKDIKKTYWGLIAPIDYDGIYSNWFSSLKYSYDFLMQDFYYSEQNLLGLLKKIFFFETAKKEMLPCDFIIQYEYGILPMEKSFCIVELQFSDDAVCSNFSSVINQFQKLIVALDELYSDVFTSAYVTNNANSAIDTLDLMPKIDFVALESKILGVEYSFYISKKLLQSNATQPQLNTFSTTWHVNGIQYTSNSSFNEFNYHLSEQELSSLGDLIMPSYGVYNWSDLCKTRKQYMKRPEMISIYYDKYSPTDPIVVFSSGYTPEDLDVLDEVSDLSIQSRYKLKDIIL